MSSSEMGHSQPNLIDGSKWGGSKNNECGICKRYWWEHNTESKFPLILLNILKQVINSCSFLSCLTVSRAKSLVSLGSVTQFPSGRQFLLIARNGSLTAVTANMVIGRVGKIWFIWFFNILDILIIINM